MAITIFLEFTAKAGTGGDLLAALKEILPDTRSYDGCIANDVYRSQENPDTLMIHGTWETKEKYETYLAWRQETGVFDKFTEGLEGPPNLRYFDPTDA
jgi:quinol monooxygenase YgiN